MHSVAAVAREAAVVLNKQAATEMETEYEAVAAATPCAHAEVAPEAAVALNKQAAKEN